MKKDKIVEVPAKELAKLISQLNYFAARDKGSPVDPELRIESERLALQAIAKARAA